MVNHRIQDTGIGYRIQTHAKPQETGYRYRIQDTGYRHMVNHRIQDIGIGYRIQKHAKPQNIQDTVYRQWKTTGYRI